MLMASSSTESGKRSPTKGVDKTTKSLASTKLARKPKKAQSETMVLSSTLEPIDAHDMIAIAAYYLAERRHFAPGYELHDWLTAEQQVMGVNSPKH
jgi:hypothetical protein